MLTVFARPAGAFLGLSLALLGGCGAGAPAPATLSGTAIESGHERPPARDRSARSTPPQPASGEGADVAAAATPSDPKKAPSAPTGTQQSKIVPAEGPRVERAQKQDAPSAPLPEGTLVLHVGDSFAGALGLPLSRRLKAAGLRSVLEFETASYIPGWASSEKLHRLVNRYDPDLVLVTLGANELEIVNPEQRIKNIRKIVATIDDRPCVWIAAPLWDGAKNGLFEIIRQNVAPCLYMDTNALISSMPRVSDGIHPTLPAREDWADVVVQWLAAHRRPTAGEVWSLSE